MDEQSTHFIFDGEKVVISPDLHSVVSFLQEIEKEIERFLNFDKKLESIRTTFRDDKIHRGACWKIKGK